MTRNLRMRHKVTKATRDFLDEKGFIEIETPILSKSTPEGARDFLVPSRLTQGKFYALPQAPQQYKQLLMVGGIEKYFQIAKCFRDEDLRADRQPEFTQIDIEASFVVPDDIYVLVEGMLAAMFRDARGVEIPTPFPRLTYARRWTNSAATSRTGVSRMHLIDLADVFRASAFKMFRGALDAGGRREGDQREGFRESHHRAEGRADRDGEAVRREGPRLHQSRKRRMEIADREILQRGGEGSAARETRDRGGRLILFAADKWEVVCEVLGRIRVSGSPRCRN